MTRVTYTQPGASHIFRWEGDEPTIGAIVFDNDPDRGEAEHVIEAAHDLARATGSTGAIHVYDGGGDQIVGIWGYVIFPAPIGKTCVGCDATLLASDPDLCALCDAASQVEPWVPAR
jgi:hypothetical protein